MTTDDPAISGRKPGAPSIASFIRLIRPHQWAKSGFVLIGPVYGFSAAAGQQRSQIIIAALIAAAIFALVSSACYIVNDIVDAPRDRAHPRKRNRPIASGEVTPAQGLVLAVILVAAAAAMLFPLETAARWGVATWAAVYAANVTLYSFVFKRVVMGDVMCLSLGFVIRVFAGCAATLITPSSWLLNCTLFLAMFLAFGKRLGERRTMGSADAATNVRAVQSVYTDELLRMSVVVTAVATLVTYAGYVTAHEQEYVLHAAGTVTAAPRTIGGLNLLWITMVPATYGLLRCIVLLERGDYDDPTELAMRDRPFQATVAAFAIITGALIAHFKLGLF